MEVLHGINWIEKVQKYHNTSGMIHNAKKWNSSVVNVVYCGKFYISYRAVPLFILKEIAQAW